MARLAAWWAGSMIVGALLGVVVAIVLAGLTRLIAAHDRSGSWRYAFERLHVDTWVVVGAIAGFTIVMLFVAWRLVVAGYVGFVVGGVTGALIGIAVWDDPSAPVDWGFLVGLALGVVVGTVLGIIVGVAWHLRHEHRRTDASRAVTDAQSERRRPDLVRGTPHAADPRPLTGHGGIAP